MSNLHKPTSSSIEHIDYLDDKSTLIIKFSSGATYHYPNVPKSEYEALKAAGSCGQHFQKHVRTKFKGSRV